MAWHAIYCEPQQEMNAAKRLTDGGFEAFCPYEKHTKHRKRGAQKVSVVNLKPLYPSYAFVNTDEYVEVEKIRGVLQFIKIDGKPVPIPSFVIDKIKALITEKPNMPYGYVTSQDYTKKNYWFSKCSPGDRFQFGGSSPLAGFCATIKNTSSADEGKIEAWVEMLGGVRSVAIPIEMVGTVLKVETKSQG
jgi:transcription antitermination factor NusG